MLLGMYVHCPLPNPIYIDLGLQTHTFLGCPKDRRDEPRVYDAGIDGLVRWRDHRVLRRFRCSTHSGHQKDQAWVGCQILIVTCLPVLGSCDWLSTYLPVEMTYDCLRAECKTHDPETRLFHCEAGGQGTKPDLTLMLYIFRCSDHVAAIGASNPFQAPTASIGSRDPQHCPTNSCRLQRVIDFYSKRFPLNCGNGSFSSLPLRTSSGCRW
jgi:hypothetical protein